MPASPFARSLRTLRLERPDTPRHCRICGMSDYGCRGDDCPTGECHSTDECTYTEEDFA